MTDVSTNDALPVGPIVEPAACSPPARRAIDGTSVSLAPLERAHTEALFAASHGDPVRERLWTYLPYGPFESETEMGEWVAERAASLDPLFLAVLDRGTDRAIGMVSYLNVDVAMRHLELGHIWYGPEAQRTKANTEASFLMLREAFEALGHRRVEWKCDALNARSRAAALRLGFSFEGIFRRHMIVKGRNRDTAWFAMIDEEWPDRKTKLERWLAAEPGAVSLAALNTVPAT